MITWEVRLRPGCYSGPEAPLVSRHCSIAAAVRKARQSDRWQVEPSTTSRAVWVPPPRHSAHGSGLYGTGPHRSECVADQIRVDTIEALVEHYCG